SSALRWWDRTSRWCASRAGSTTSPSPRRRRVRRTSGLRPSGRPSASPAARRADPNWLSTPLRRMSVAGSTLSTGVRTEGGEGDDEDDEAGGGDGTADDDGGSRAERGDRADGDGGGGG